MEFPSKRKGHTGVNMEELQKHIRAVLFQELQKLEELEAFCHYQESIAREIMNRAQMRLVEIEDEKAQIMQNSIDLKYVKVPITPYQRPFLFADDDWC